MLVLLALQNRVGNKLNLGVMVDFPKNNNYASVFKGISNLNTIDFCVYIAVMLFTLASFYPGFFPSQGYWYVAY